MIYFVIGIVIVIFSFSLFSYCKFCFVSICLFFAYLKVSINFVIVALKFIMYLFISCVYI